MRITGILWSLVLLCCIGCGKKAEENPFPELQKLTLKDLKPADATQFQPQIVFDIVTFEMPAGRVQDIPVMLAQFEASNIRIYNKELFSKNGLNVFYGKGSDGEKLSAQLRLLDVRRIIRTNLITMDKADELFSTSIFSVERYVFSTIYGDQKTRHVFGPGRIGFVITPSLTVRRDSVDIKIVPAYVPAEGANIRMAIGKNELGQRAFGQGRLEVVMQEGDFLVLAPNRVPTETTLDKMLFGPEGAKEKMRIYVILFIRAGQE